MTNLFRSTWIAVLLTMFASPASALFEAESGGDGETCPLTNAAYRDLRASAAALEQGVRLPPGCEQIQTNIGQAGAEITTLIRKLLGTTAETPAGGKDQVAIDAVAALTQLSKVYAEYANRDDRCGKALLSKTDYLNAVVDTTMSVTPYLTRYTGALGGAVALGLDTVGSTVRIFAKLFRGSDFNMSTPEHRRAFIENACAYYRLNDGVVALMQARFGEATIADARLETLRATYQHLKDNPPRSGPTADVLLARSRVQRDREHLTELRGKLQLFARDAEISCALLRSEIAGFRAGESFPALSVRSYKDFLREDKEVGLDVNLKEWTLTQFATLALARELAVPAEGAAATDAAACVAKGEFWLTLAGEILTSAEAELQRPGRLDLACSSTTRAHQVWEEALAEAKARMDAAEARLKFIRSLAREGEDLEIAEILASRDAIARSLFGDSRGGLLNRGGSPAKSWAQHALRQSETARRRYLTLAPEALAIAKGAASAPGGVPKRLCDDVQGVYLVWLNAHRHASSVRSFCSAFAQTFRTADLREMRDLCFKNDGVLVAAERQLESSTADADSILRWLQAWSCAGSSAASDLETVASPRNGVAITPVEGGVGQCRAPRITP